MLHAKPLARLTTRLKSKTTIHPAPRTSRPSRTGCLLTLNSILSPTHRRLPHFSFKSMLTFFLTQCCVELGERNRITHDGLRRPHDERSSVEITNHKYAGWGFLVSPKWPHSASKTTLALQERNFCEYPDVSISGALLSPGGLEATRQNK